MRSILFVIGTVAVATALLAAPALAKPAICQVPLDQRAAAIEAAPGPFNSRVMAAADEAIGEYIAANPARYQGWSRPSKTPVFFISDCYRWQRVVAEANYSGEIKFVAELLDDTTVGALRVAIHERFHQWQPRWQTKAEQAALEAEVQLLERLLAPRVQARLGAVLASR